MLDDYLFILSEYFQSDRLANNENVEIYFYQESFPHQHDSNTPVNGTKRWFSMLSNGIDFTHWRGLTISMQEPQFDLRWHPLITDDFDKTYWTTVWPGWRVSQKKQLMLYIFAWCVVLKTLGPPRNCTWDVAFWQSNPPLCDDHAPELIYSSKKSVNTNSKHSNRSDDKKNPKRYNVNEN